MTDRAEEIMSTIQAIALDLGLPLVLDRAYPVMTDPVGDGPADMPLVVLRTGDEEMDNPDAKAWGRRWVMRPALIFFLQNKENPNALRSQANALWLAFLAGAKASPLQSLLTRTSVPVMSKDLQPMAGRPDVLMLVVGFELRFER